LLVQGTSLETLFARSITGPEHAAPQWITGKCTKRQWQKQAIGDLLRLYAGPQFEIRVRLVLAADAVPRCQLGGDEQEMALSGSRLGWTAWLGGGPPRDRGDAMFAVA